jgi:pimeloyl-ACP methyl ester carboxylesterase
VNQFALDITNAGNPTAMTTSPTDGIDNAYRTRHRYATVKGRRIFYREAGDPSAPTIILLHGLPTSSQMFRGLIPLLSDQFHLVAPDYIGFGHSDAPSNAEFKYTFDELSAHVAGLIDLLRLESYVLYMQDYGGPIGFRIFANAPEQVSGFVIQNANAYMEGVGDAPKEALMPLWENRDPKTELPAREFVSLAGTKLHWLVGANNPEYINPDNWILDQALLDRPGTQDYQVDLLENYKTNVALYDTWQAAFREHKPRTLIVWGKNDPFFVPAGAVAYKRDIPDAKVVWLDGGHFVLDEYAVNVAHEIRSFFGKPMRDQEKIAEIAYFIWLSEGNPDGCAEEHWRQAEALYIAQLG